MKLINKKTGEIVRVEFLNDYQTDDGTEIGFRDCVTNNVYSYNSLCELNKEWEDYIEEPKGYWFVDSGGEVEEATYLTENDKANLANFGNCFATKEEAEKAVEKLKAWKRLKDKGFEITEWAANGYGLRLYAHYSKAGIKDELDLLFGSEE